MRVSRLLPGALAVMMCFPAVSFAADAEKPAVADAKAEKSGCRQEKMGCE
jgi:hypothetical protein